jgi:hypothetical protein
MKQVAADLDVLDAFRAFLEESEARLAAAPAAEEKTPRAAFLATRPRRRTPAPS